MTGDFVPNLSNDTLGTAEDQHRNIRLEQWLKERLDFGKLLLQ